jgi:hypothetical protein
MLAKRGSQGDQKELDILSTVNKDTSRADHEVTDAEVAQIEDSRKRAAAYPQSNAVDSTQLLQIQFPSQMMGRLLFQHLNKQPANMEQENERLLIEVVVLVWFARRMAHDWLRLRICNVENDRWAIQIIEFLVIIK